jgi:hypothetical protein
VVELDDRLEPVTLQEVKASLEAAESRLPSRLASRAVVTR